MRWLLWLSLAVGAQTLPDGAVVVERRAIPASVRANRELVLWVLKPTKFDRGPNTNDNVYTCPDRTRGSHFTGPSRLSLVDTRAGVIVNTVEIHFYGEDTFDLPYLIRPDQGYYRVPGVAPEAEGKPVLLDLRDLNGDGLALETAFYDAQACMGLPTAAFGYSPRQDRVIHYETQLDVRSQDYEEGRGLVGPVRRKIVRQGWVEYLFDRKPEAPGYWKYQVDFSGRGGSRLDYEIRYDPNQEMFRGTLVETIVLWK
jgi:hypothetical protein